VNGAPALKIVDPTNPIPKYLQISSWLKDLVQSGRYKEGEKLPSEIVLSKLCNVHRNTLRQAISELTAEGILRKEKGMGTFVSSPKPMTLRHKLERIPSFRDDLGDSGIRETTKVLSKGTEIAPVHVAKTLALNSKKKVIVIRRLRAGNEVPLIYEESYTPQEMFKGILNMDLTRSMYQILTEQYNTVLARSEQIIRAVNLELEIAKLFDLPENSAGFYMESETYNEKNIPIEVLYSYYRGDKYVFEVELGRYFLKA
jgi:GntR family transcriptional regulator